MTKLLSGKPAAGRLNLNLATRSESLRQQGITPVLAVVRLGERPDDLAYERGLLKRAEKTGVEVRRYTYPQNLSQEKFLEALSELANDPEIHGILPFRPFPGHIGIEAVRAQIPAEKDVDGLTDLSLAKVFAGTGRGFAPCTAEAVMEMLDYYEIDLDGKNVAVLGRSLVIGKPVAAMLLAKNATVTTCHTHTKNLPEILQRQDILVLCAGSAGCVDKSCFCHGQKVIDVSVNFDENGKMIGDAVFEDADGTVAAITPVPGGVGAITTGILMRHVIEAAEATLAK